MAAELGRAHPAPPLAPAGLDNKMQNHAGGTPLEARLLFCGPSQKGDGFIDFGLTSKADRRYR